MTLATTLRSAGPLVDATCGSSGCAGTPPRSARGVPVTDEVRTVLDTFDRDFVGLKRVKKRIRDVAAMAGVNGLRAELGLPVHAPPLHMSFSGNPGTGKSAVAARLAHILHRLGCLRTAHLVCVRPDELAAGTVSRTAAKIRAVVQRSIGGVLFVDSAPSMLAVRDEHGSGRCALDILLQVAQARADEIVLILAGHPGPMKALFDATPGLHDSLAHHLKFPDYSPDELIQIADRLLERQGCFFTAESRRAFQDYLSLRVQKPHFANVHSVLRELDRVRLRQAGRLLEAPRADATREALGTIEPADIRKGRLFSEQLF